MSNQIVFKPWVGKDYATGGCFKKRIMVLGESHYLGEDDMRKYQNNVEEVKDTTTNVINAHLHRESNDAYLNTFTKFERSLVNDYTNQEQREAVWQSLVFYNYVQEPMKGPREAASEQQYKNSAAPFYEVMEEYQPDCLIVWGHRLWNHLPWKNWKDGTGINVGETTYYNGTYQLDSSKTVQVLRVKHPSASYSWDVWYEVICRFLSLS